MTTTFTITVPITITVTASVSPGSEPLITSDHDHPMFSDPGTAPEVILLRITTSSGSLQTLPSSVFENHTLCDIETEALESAKEGF